MKKSTKVGASMKFDFTLPTEFALPCSFHKTIFFPHPLPIQDFLKKNFMQLHCTEWSS